MKTTTEEIRKFADKTREITSKIDDPDVSIAVYQFAREIMAFLMRSGLNVVDNEDE